MIEQTLEIPLSGGTSTTFIVRPERDGPHPLIMFLMDAPGIREELRDMARRLASAGYYVMLPNLYYRAGVLELVPPGGAMDDALRERMMGLMNGLTIPMVMDDVEALVAFASGQPDADVSRIGSVGYCMSGQFAINAAVRLPQVKAAASIHGTYLVTDADDSPHRRRARVRPSSTSPAPRPTAGRRWRRWKRCARPWKPMGRGPRWRSIRAPSTASPSRSARSTRSRAPSGTGSG